MRGDSCPYDHGTDRIILDDRALKGQFGGHAPPGGMPPNLGQPPFYGAPNAPNAFGEYPSLIDANPLRN
jgi:hypothetical protein